MRQEGSVFQKLEVYLIRALVLLITTLLLLNIFLIYRNAEVIEYNKNLQEETEKIKVNTLDIIRTIHQMDMGLRGYALIDSEVQLKVATDGFIRMDSILARLKQSLRGQNFPMRSIEVLEDSLNIYFNTIRTMLTLVKEDRKDEFNDILRQDLGLYAYYSYVRFSEHVNAFEDRIAAEAKERYNQALKNSYLLQIVLFFITTPALIIMLYLFNKTLRISRELREAEHRAINILARQKKELERQVRERTNEILAQNEEISAQNEEIVSHNEQLISQQFEIERQRVVLEEKNTKLEEANQTIEEQNAIIQQKNLALVAEVDHQTQDLRRTNLELVEQNSRLEQFAYIISHNLRSPMARLMGLSSLLKYEVREDEKANIINLMLRSTSEFDNVFKDLSLILDIQRLSFEVLRTITLEDTMQKVRRMLRQEIEQTEAELAQDFSKAPTLLSLPQYIESILYNLVSNALKYRSPDRRPVIRVASMFVDGLFQLSIQDNGLGINLSRHKDSVFSLYKRFHFHVEGKGLGLYLVRTQVEALRGKIKSKAS